VGGAIERIKNQKTLSPREIMSQVYSKLGKFDIEIKG